MTPAARELARGAIVQVGAGRGFVVEAGEPWGRLVVTAAHCLPTLPEPMPARYTGECTFPSLLGPLADPEATVMAECLYADVINDVAVLGRPDNQTYGDDADAYEAFIEVCEPLVIAPMRARIPWSIEPAPIPAWALSRDEVWRDGEIIGRPGRIYTRSKGIPIQGGMSGSPFLDTDGRAVALVSVGEVLAADGGGKVMDFDGPHPALPETLPVWLVTACRRRGRRSGRPALAPR